MNLEIPQIPLCGCRGCLAGAFPALQKRATPRNHFQDVETAKNHERLRKS